MACMDCCKSCAKCLLILFNIIFGLFAVAVFAIACLVIIFFIYEGVADTLISSHVSVSLLEVGAALMIGFSILLVVVSFLGCYGACMERRGLLVVFLILLMFVIAVELAAGVLVVMFKTKLDSVEVEMKVTVLETLKHDNYYKNKTSGDATTVGFAFNVLQKQFDCCAVDSPIDYMGSNLTLKTGMGIPYTCCHLKPEASIFNLIKESDVEDWGVCQSDFTSYSAASNGSSVQVTQLYTEGCYQSFLDFVTEGVPMYLAIALVFLFLALEVLSVLFACCLCCCPAKDVNDD